MEHKIIVAGIGPGNPDYMVPAAAKAIAQAQVLVGGSRALAQFGANAKQTMTIKSNIAAVMEFIDEALVTDNVVVMVSGDPGYYSLLDALRRSFPADAIIVIPGISSVQLAFSRLSLPWHDAKLISMHGREARPQDMDYETGRMLGILTDKKYNSHSIPLLLMENGWPADTGLAICSRLSYDDEVVIETTLGGAEEYDCYTACILVVMAEGSPGRIRL